MKKYSVLGGISPQKFLREYWHKQPLLIRQAIPGFTSPLARDALFALAANADVESRLITHDKGEWTFEHGPFKRLPSLRKKNWTALVQGVNLHDDKAATLLEEFRFVPDARLDDLMISYATTGGGVGPHFDSYDVFLLQAQGKRRWRIGAQQDLSLVEGLPLKILKHFAPEQEFVLEPGDMLYLPPHYAHDGVALDECITCSIGFRAPSWQELGEGFLQSMADSLELSGRYADPKLRPTQRPAEIPIAMLDQLTDTLRRIAFEQDDAAIFLGEYLSEPKPSVVFIRPERPLSRARFLSAAHKRGIKPARQTRMLYRGRHLFVNGESYEPRSVERALLRTLADERRLAPAAVSRATEDVQDALFTWYQNGWLVLG